MKQRFTWIAALLMALLWSAFHGVSAQEIQDFSLKNHDGKMVSLKTFRNKTATVVIFTGNHCVYSKKYEARLVKMGQTYQGKNVQFLLINSNNPETNQEETLEANAAKAKENAYPFPYLQDADHAVAENFGATKQPEVFVLIPGEGDQWQNVYSGKIDDNPLMAEKVKDNYLQQILDQLLSGDKSPMENTDPSGCSIRF